MSALSKLRATLKSVASDGVTGPQEMPFSAPELGAVLILDAVDKAVMARRITVSVGAGGLVLEAAGRRLQRLCAPVPDHIAISAGAEITASNAAALAAGLMALCEGHARLNISNQPITEAGDPTQGGIPTGPIRQELGFPAADADLEEPSLDTILSPIAEACQVALWIEGEEVTLLLGEEDRGAALSDWVAPMLERVLAPEFPLSAMLETDGIAVFALPDADGRHVFIAGRLGDLLVAEINSSDIAATLAAWKAARS